MTMKWLMRAATIAAMVAVLSGTALAFTGTPDQAGPTATPSGITMPLGGGFWGGLVNGFLAGVVAVFYGYAKNKDPKTGAMESFDIRYAFPTLVVGGLVGVAASLLKVSPQDLSTSLTASPVYGAVVFAVEAVLKAAFRHSVPWLRDALGAIKGHPEEPKR